MPKQTITIPLTEYIDAILGRWVDEKGEYQHQHFSKPIPKDTAFLIFSITQNEHTCFIQWADKYNPELKQPHLWDWAAWQTHSDKWERAKARSDYERQERYVFEANVKMLLHPIMDYFSVPKDNANIIATNWVRKNNTVALEIVGLSRFYTMEDKLP